MRDSGDDLEGDWCTIVEYDGTVAEENMEQDSSQSSPQFPPAPSQPLSSLPSSQTQGQGKKKEKNKFFDDIMSSAKSKLMDQFYNVYSRYPETPPTFKKDEIFCLGKSFSPSFYPPPGAPPTPANTLTPPSSSTTSAAPSSGSPTAKTSPPSPATTPPPTSAGAA
eukprot:TRINITY_DN21914_c1_g2_i1.p1 TRINITY_DN21914_c1_g2~~TRINITY_DN21914_c1_g2_i1.p1  ORF type:complete len:165 (+),score=47.65 TRINITY_DN21914_c1_g2_i1:59-553(+)